MRIGLPTETKDNEFRTAMAPAGVHQLVEAGHEVLVQSGAGVGAKISDEAYAEAGARIVDTAAEAWTADLVTKVKEPTPEEYAYLRPDLTLFTYLHLAADEPLTRRLVESGTTAFAYEEVQLPDGTLPLLAPMSEVAGRLSAQVGAYHLMSANGGSGVLLGGVPGAPRGKVLIIGGGVVGRHAAEIAVGMRADVTVIDVNVQRLRQLDEQFAGRIHTRASSAYTIAQEARSADLIIGSVLRRGERAPHVLSSEVARTLKPGTVLVDIAIDQGGCFEDSRPTTHATPTFRVGDAIFYCVGNMPGAVPVTATAALTAATLGYISELANFGWEEASRRDPVLLSGLVSAGGVLYSEGAGQAHGIDALPPSAALS